LRRRSEGEGECVCTKAGRAAGVRICVCARVFVEEGREVESVSVVWCCAHRFVHKASTEIVPVRMSAACWLHHIFKINIDIPLQMSGECGKDHDAGLSGDDTDTEDDRQYMATTNQMHILVALLQQQPASRPRLEQHHDRHEASDAAENGVLFPAIGPKTFEESLAETRMSHGGATRPRASRLQSSFQLP